MVGSVLWVNKVVTDTENWLKASSRELRANLALIIKEYGITLNETLVFVDEVLKLTDKYACQFDLLSAARECLDAGDNQNGTDILRLFDPYILRQTIAEDRVKQLSNKYGLLIHMLDAEIGRLKQEQAGARKRMWIYIGVAALSAVVLAGCIALTVVSCGAAAPIVAVGAVAAVEGTVAVGGIGTAGTRFLCYRWLYLATVGLGIGIAGTVASAANLITTATLAGQVASFSSPLSELRETYIESAKELSKTKEHIFTIQSAFSELSSVGGKVADLSTLPILVKKIPLKDIADSIEQVNQLKKKAQELKANVNKHRSVFVGKLIAVQNELQYKYLL
jgi:hypothetical protein